MIYSHVPVWFINKSDVFIMFYVVSVPPYAMHFSVFVALITSPCLIWYTLQAMRPLHKSAVLILYICRIGASKYYSFLCVCRSNYFTLSDIQFKQCDSFVNRLPWSCTCVVSVPPYAMHFSVFVALIISPCLIWYRGTLQAMRPLHKSAVLIVYVCRIGAI